MAIIRSIFIGLATSSLLLSSVESFAPVKSGTRTATRTATATAVQSFKFPDLPDFSSFFGGDAAKSSGAGANNSNSKASKTTVIAGASGYIGKSTVRESVRQGYNTIALVRDLEKVENAQGKMMYGQFFEGAKVVQCDVCDVEALTKVSYSISYLLSYLLSLVVDDGGVERCYYYC